MSLSLSRLSSLFAVGAVAFLLTGCADQDARNDAVNAKKSVDTLKAEVDNLQKELAAVKEQVAGMRSALEQKITEKMDGIAKGMTDTESNLRKAFTEQMSKNADEYKSLLTDADSRLNARLKSYLDQDLAEAFGKMREEIKTNREELIGYMGLNLKELYPYAYQPKRLEDPSPPTDPK